MFGEIVEVTDPYPHPELLYEDLQVLTRNQVLMCEARMRLYKTSRRDSPRAVLNIQVVEAIEAKSKETHGKILENRAWERKHGTVYVKPYNDGIIPDALKVPVTNDDEAVAFNKEWLKYQTLANADKRRQIRKMVEEKKFRVYRQLACPEPTQKLVWRLNAPEGPVKAEQPAPAAKAGKRSQENENAGSAAKAGKRSCMDDFIDLTQDDD